MHDTAQKNKRFSPFKRGTALFAYPQDLDPLLDVKGLAQVIKDGPQWCRQHLGVQTNKGDSCR